MNILKRNFVETVLVIAFASIIAITFVSAVVQARELNNDPVTATADAVDNVAVHFELAAETTATSTILVDRSDTTNFPHDFVGGTGIEVAQINIDWIAESNATTTVKFGLIASSTDSGNVVDVYWFDSISFVAQDLTGTLGKSRQSKSISYSPSVIKLDMASGVPASFLTNDSSLSTGAYATTTSLYSPNGYINPGVGDLVMQVYDQKGTATTSASTVYRTR